MYNNESVKTKSENRDLMDTKFYYGHTF